MSNSSRITPLPTRPALVRRGASVVAVTAAVAVVGCSASADVPPQTPQRERTEGQPPQVEPAATAPEVRTVASPPPQVPHPPQVATPDKD